MRKSYKRWYRRIRTTPEKRANQDGWCRAKRNTKNLPDSWDDIPATVTKNWKDYRKTQYYPNGRGKRHELTINYLNTKDAWDFKEYCRVNNIPCAVEDITEKCTRTYKVYTKSVPAYKIRQYCMVWDRKEKKIVRGHQIGWKQIYKEVKLDKPIVKSYTYTRIVAQKLIWWSDKDIGIKYILCL